LSDRKIKHSQADRGLDLYQTDPVAVYALLRHARLPHRIWEPQCGPGNIVRVLRAEGHDVLATDIHDYASRHQDVAGMDFLQTYEAPYAGIEAIVMNAPFYADMECVDRALDLVPKVYSLMRLTWLESEGRHAFFKQGWLRRVLVFSNRLPMMHRDGWDGPIATSTIAMAWFCFDRENRGECVTDWIKWVELTKAQRLAIDS